MLYGLDYLGGVQYQDLIMNNHPPGWASGIFLDTFGNAIPLIDKLARKGSCPRIRVHLLWKDNHIYTDKDIPKIIQGCKRLVPLIKDYKNVEFRISPCCEHNMKAPLLLKVYKTVIGIVGRERYVNSPLPGAARIENVRNEIHGRIPENLPHGTYDFSFDKIPSVDSDVETYKKSLSDAETFYFWDSRFNGRWEPSDNTPIENRKGWPDEMLLDSIIYLHNTKGDTSLPKGWIYKSHSENKNGTDPRREKPVMIAPIKAPVISLEDRNKNVIETMLYYGTYIDGGFRYYADSWGFELAEKAKKIQNSSICNVVIQGKTYGSINPAFRDGLYR